MKEVACKGGGGGRIGVGEKVVLGFTGVVVLVSRTLAVGIAEAVVEGTGNPLPCAGIRRCTSLGHQACARAKHSHVTVHARVHGAAAVHSHTATGRTCLW